MYYDSVILSLLMIKPMHGYEIKKSLEDFNKRVNGSEISNNTLYPLLSRYEKSGVATKQTFAQEGKPNRIQYAITDFGREYFYKSLNKIDRQVIVNRDDFFIRLSFFPVLTPANRKKLLDQRETLSAIPLATVTLSLCQKPFRLFLTWKPIRRYFCRFITDSNKMSSI